MGTPAGVQFQVGVNEDAPSDTGSVTVKGLKFAFPMCDPFIKDFSIDLPPGSRCLLSGANGAGKSTLLQVLAGKFMVAKDMIQVMGQPPFHTTSLTCSGELQYLGGSWRRDVAFAGN